jgi:uncharacterized membrane protein YedE/YeeE
MEFTPIASLVGGGLIGLAASVLLLANGRIAGISGIYKGILRPTPGDLAWRIAFIGGLVLTGTVLSFAAPGMLEASSARSLQTTALAGLVVGVGVSLGNGCTSGHGVCGLSRFSRRSLVATLTFLTTGFITATTVQVVFGGEL